MRITLTQLLDGRWLYAVHQRRIGERWLPVCNGGTHDTAEDALWRAEEIAALTMGLEADGPTDPR